MLPKNIDNSNFLWVTRGEKWGFRYLSKCSLLAPHNAEYIYEKIFLPDENLFGHWNGIIDIEGRQYQYVACRCYDSHLQLDAAGRRIPHEFLLLCSEEDYTELRDIQWETQVFDKIREQYLEIFYCQPDEVRDCDIVFTLAASSENKTDSDVLNISIFSANNSLIDNISKYKFWGILILFLALLAVAYNKFNPAPAKTTTKNISTTSNFSPQPPHNIEKGDLAPQQHYNIRKNE